MPRLAPTLWIALIAVFAFAPAASAQDDNDGDGYTVDDGDCNDCDADVHPGASEACNEVDDNCDGSVDEGFDDNGDGVIDCYDDDGDGFTEEEGDCDDHDAAVSPGIPEACNGIDDDCDGEVDQGMDGHVTHIALDGTSDCVDDDGDGYAEIDGDCDDNSQLVHEFARELCLDGVDNDCNGEIDYDDHQCQERAEEASGIIVCRPEEDDDDTAAAGARRYGWALAGLLLMVVIRRSPAD